MKTLKDVLPWDARAVESLQKYLDVEVMKEYSLGDDDTWKRWPGTHKNVMNWYVLVNGKAVGFNENPAIGWSFPIITYKG